MIRLPPVYKPYTSPAPDQQEVPSLPRQDPAPSASEPSREDTQTRLQGTLSRPEPGRPMAERTTNRGELHVVWQMHPPSQAQACARAQVDPPSPTTPRHPASYAWVETREGTGPASRPHPSYRSPFPLAVSRRQHLQGQGHAPLCSKYVPRPQSTCRHTIPRPHAYRTLSASGASGQMSPFTCLHANSHGAGAPARQSVASGRDPRCQTQAVHAAFQMPSSPAEKSRPPSPKRRAAQQGGRTPNGVRPPNQSIVPVPHSTMPRAPASRPAIAPR